MKYLIFAAALIVLASCHTTKKVTTTTTLVQSAKSIEQMPATVNIELSGTTYRPPDSTQKADIPITKADSIPQLTESIYGFKVSFFSNGSGINTKAKQKYTGFVNGYESKNRVQISYEEVATGQEGEVDFGFKFIGINAVQRARFVMESKEFLKEFELVRYSEHFTPSANSGGLLPGAPGK